MRQLFTDLAFVEAGNNWGNYQDFNPFKMYKAAGFGARIFMPAFGLIGLNWAYGFDSWYPLEATDLSVVLSSILQ